MKLLKAVLAGTSLTYPLIETGVSGFTPQIQNAKTASTCLLAGNSHNKDDVDRRGLLKSLTTLIGSAAAGTSLLPFVSLAEIYDDTASMSNTNFDA